MVYHSNFVDEGGVDIACGCPLLPLKSHIKGPAPVSDQAYDNCIYMRTGNNQTMASSNTTAAISSTPSSSQKEVHSSISSVLLLTFLLFLLDLERA